jgi:hypothetical protein
MNPEKIYRIIALGLFILFFLPYVWKLQELSLTVVIAIGVVLAVLDFRTANKSD